MARLSELSTLELHAVVAEACSAWDPRQAHEPFRAYVERHGPAHMLSARRLDAARTRLGDLAFMAAFAASWDTVVVPLAVWRLLGVEGLEDALVGSSTTVGHETDDDLATVAEFLQSAGRWEGALQLAERAREMATGASALWARLRVAALEDVLERDPPQERASVVLDDATATLGREHALVLLARTHAVGEALREGNLDAAEALAEQDVAACAERFGDGHPETLTAVSHLSTVMRRTGRLVEARALATRVAEGRAAVLGDTHPSTLVAMSNLAVVMRADGDASEARSLLERVVEKQRRLLGPGHPATLGSVANLCVTLRDLGEPEEAVRWCREALDAAGSRSGEAVRTVRMHGAMALADLDALDEAAAWLEAVLRSSEDALGVEHPDTLTARYKLASVCARAGDTEQAERLLREVLAGRTESLGAGHRQTRIAREGLAELLEEAERHAESLPLRRAEVALDDVAEGDETPDEAQRVYALGQCLRRAGHSAEALGVYERALRAERRLHGARDPTLAATHWALAACLATLGRFSEAVVHRRACLALERREAGGLSEDVLVTVVALVGDLDAAGDRAAAARFRQRYLREARALVGSGQDDETFAAHVAALEATRHRPPP